MDEAEADWRIQIPANDVSIRLAAQSVWEPVMTSIACSAGRHKYSGYPLNLEAFHSLEGINLEVLQVPSHPIDCLAQYLTGWAVFVPEWHIVLK